MPRRKQDNPQHLEEDMKIDQLISSAVRDCVENMRCDRQMVGDADVHRRESILDCVVTDVVKG